MVVEDIRECNQRSAVDTSHFPDPYHRRKWCRMGSASKLPDNPRDVGKGIEDEIIQLEGIESSRACTSILPERVKRTSLENQV